jgi:hypothetical protein
MVKSWILVFLLFGSAIPALGHNGAAGPKSWLHRLRGSGHPQQRNNNVVTKHHSTHHGVKHPSHPPAVKKHPHPQHGTRRHKLHR